VKVRQASFALRIVRRRDGDAAILYRRTLNEKQEERLTRVAGISSLAFSAGSGLLRAAVRASLGTSGKLTPGPFIPLDNDWGARVACYALVASGLRNPARLAKAAENLRHSDGTEAAWWLGMMNQHNGSAKRAVRSLRILAEAVK
jgi:hypothetical protein